MAPECFADPSMWHSERTSVADVAPLKLGQLWLFRSGLPRKS